MANNIVKRSNCPVCTEIAIRVQQIAQERDGYMLAAFDKSVYKPESIARRNMFKRARDKYNDHT